VFPFSVDSATSAKIETRMASLFVEEDGRLVLKDTLETMARAKLRIKALRISEPAD
jgi:hypothetical protein